MAKPHRLMDVDVLLLGSVEDFPRFTGVDGKGLLAKDVFSSRNGSKAIPFVKSMRGTDVDTVDIGVNIQFIVASVDSGLSWCVAEVLGRELFVLL